MPQTSLLLCSILVVTGCSAFSRGAPSFPRIPSTRLQSTDFDYCVGILGDLHIDPRKMQDYEVGRSQWRRIFQESLCDSQALVSLGDLGESKNCDHNPSNPSELFAGTTLCHQMASDFLGSFGVPYEVIGGNHDLEGIDEFGTDQENLDVFLSLHGKPTPQFCRKIADKTLLVGLTSTVFRDAAYTSHEVTIDAAQVAWFEQLLESHPDHNIFVFTHAPPNGSGLRVLQENHVVNGCCWLNHSGESAKFIDLVRKHDTIKAWFSGHFHLGQDYQDSVTFPITPSGPAPNRGSCVFAQTSVMRSGSSRDTRQQSRLLRGNSEGFEICTVDHKNNGAIRVDAQIQYPKTAEEEMGIFVFDHSEYDHDDYFKVYQPCAGDETNPPDDGYVQYEDSFLLDEPVDKDTVKWWRMTCGRALGMLNGMLIEYDASTLAPLGLVVGSDELVGKRIGVIDSGLEECEINYDTIGMEGADCATTNEFTPREQAVILVDKEDRVTVVQPNEDGSYWRKIVRNKMIRMKEVRREKAAAEFAETVLGNNQVISSWGPYTTTSGWARKTGVSGLTTPAELTESV